MKLSEMTGDQFAEIVAKIADPVEKILSDEETMKKAVSYNDAKGAVRAARLIGLAGHLLSAHKVETYAILAAMNDKTVEEIGAQTAEKLTDDVKNALTSDILDFFK